MRDVRTELKALGVDEASFRVVALLPLVSVAWADGRVQRSERALIMKLAREKGWLSGNAPELLESWLQTPPEPEMISRALGVLRLLANSDRGLGNSFAVQTLPELLRMCRDVAAAAGGAWGLSVAITPEEEVALGEIAEALALDTSTLLGDKLVESPSVDPSDPPMPERHILLGHVPYFSEQPLEYLPAVTRKLGPLVGLDFVKQKVALVAHPDYIEHVFINNARNYEKGEAWDAFSGVFGDSLLSRNGEPWRRVRRIVQPTFHQQAIGGFAESIVDVVTTQFERLDSALAQDEPIDLFQEMCSMTLGVISRILFSIDIAAECPEFRDAMNVAFERFARLMLSPVMVPDVIPTAHNREFKQAKQVFDDLFFSQIERHRDGKVEGDLLAMLMATRYEDTGEGMTDVELRDECFALVFAGFETSANALTFLFATLSRHPLVASELEAEVMRVLGDRAPRTEDLAQLRYNRAVIDETLRLYPPAWFFTRDAVAEDWIDGRRIAKGTMMLACPWVTHRLPEFWPNPEGFDPRRFLDPEVKRHRGAYIPFGIGQHRCVGMNLALLEMQLIVPLVVQRYRLSLLSGFQIRYDTRLTLRPVEGVPMQLRPGPMNQPSE